MPRPHQHSRLVVGSVEVAVVRKQMKSLRLGVSPAGDVRVSAPFSVGDRDVRKFVESQTDWIERQREELASVRTEPVFEFVEGEIHWVWGEQLSLGLSTGRQSVGRSGGLLKVVSRVGSTTISRQRQVDSWYREQLQEAIPDLVARWEPIVDVSVTQWRVRKMKTRWGTCNISAGRIWISLSLAKYRPELLEYVVVHELVHLQERLHGDRFQRLMSEVLPEWKLLKAELNVLPLR